MSLWDMSLAGGVIILAVTVLRAVTFDRLPKGTFLCLWAVALCRLLTPYTLPSALSVYTLWGRLTATEPAQIVATPGRLPPTVQAPRGFTPVTSDVAAVTAPIDWLVVIWLAVALTCSLFFAVSYCRCWRMFRTAMPVESAAAETWLADHPLRRKVRLRVSGRITTPLTYGVLRPVILLPEGIDWTDGEDLSYVLCHELTHIRRFDAVTKLLLTAAVCLHWFNPAVWVMYALANRDLELSCDEAVVRQLGPDRRRAYAAALIRMEERRGGPAPLINHFSKNAMEERIVAIMKIRKTPLAALILAVTLVAGVTIALATTAEKPTVQETVDDALAADPAAYTDEGDTEQTKLLLDAYAPFGLRYDSTPGKLNMSWQGKPVHSVFDAKKGVWIANNMRGLDLGPDAIDLQAVYDSQGDLTGMEEIKEPVGSNEERSREDLLAEYGHYGISFDSAGNMLYEGVVVGLFVDGVELDNGGWAVRYVYQSDVGAQCLRTLRDRKDNGDGSYDPFGPLTGIRAMTDRELAELGHIHESAVPGLEAVSVNTGSVTEDDSVDFRDAFNEKFKPYGVSFVPSGAFGNVYWNGQLVKIFEDKTPDGGYQTISSLDGGGICLKAVYGADGRLTGVAETDGPIG